MNSTFFAPAGRADKNEISEQHLSIKREVFITAMLRAVPDFMMVLNEQRQIIAVNNRLLEAYGITDPSRIIGLRQGEVVGCIHSNEGPGGCGTSEHCSVCGAVLTLLASQQSGEQVEGECRLSIARNGGTALDLEVTATPLDVNGTPLTILVLKDIGPDKRRQVLERTFFHDILNTVGGISGIAEMLADGDELSPESEAEYKQLIVSLSENLAEEIAQQRRLLSAEKNEYVPEMKDTDLAEVLQEVCSLYGNHIRTPDRLLRLEDAPACHVMTDRAMLRRIVGNMVLNALEATPVGGTVTVAYEVGSNDVCIKVTNVGEIPKEVQLGIFKRSFSTKSKTGRGIGTYSMKLFGERYLGCSVGFKSDQGETSFFIKHPLPV
jgi:signal transduction histidine kinase